MKTFINKVLFFTIFALIFSIIYIVVWGEIAPREFQKNLNYRLGSSGHLYSRIREIKNYGNVDILVLGSSHAYRSFDPRIFVSQNIKMFNLGSSAQSPIQTEILVKKYIDYLKPKIVIYEVYPHIFELDGVESSLDLITNDTIDINAIEMVFQINHLKVYTTFIYSLWRQIFSLDKNYKEPVKKDKDDYVKGGYVAREIGYNAVKKHYEKQKYSIQKDQEKAFKNTLELLKERGIIVVLVQAPFSKEWYNSFTNNKEMNAYLNSFGLKYYNFNKILNLDSRVHFFDSNHLNQKGVDIFDNKLIEILEKEIL